MMDRPVPRLRPLVFLVAFVLALALQTTVLNSLAIAGVKPDLVLVVGLCAGLLAGPGAGALYGAAAGLMEGYAQGMVVGSLGISRLSAAFLVGPIETRLLQDNVIVPTAMVLVGTLVANGVYFILAPQFPLARSLRIAGMEALLNMIVTPLLYLALARWGRVYR